MKKRFFSLFMGLLIACLCGCSPQSAIQTDGSEKVALEETPLESLGGDEQSYLPVKKSGGGKFNIGFIDIDPYPYTAMMLYDVVEALKEDGWITYNELPFDRENVDARALVDWLARQDLGEYIQFRADANYYTLVDGEEAIRESYAAHAAAGDLDLMLAWATGPAQLAAEFADEIPVIAYPISDPIGSGIVKGVEYSGVKNVWAHIDTMRYPRQLQVFHEVYPFTRMGVIYYDESIASIGDYETAAQELGVELLKKKIPALTNETGQDSAQEEAAYYAAFFAALQELMDEGIDAFLLTTDMMKDEAQVNRMVQLCNQKNIPICVQSGDNFVEAGCFMTVQIIDSVDLGRFVASTIGKVLNGAKPEELMQLYVSTPYVVLNLDACKTLGIDLPFEMLISCEKIYSAANE